MSSNLIEHTEEKYCSQIDSMTRKALEWIAVNPTADVKIQWNFPPGSLVIQSISAALDSDTVNANPEGRQLLDAMWAGLPEEYQPTVFMCKSTVELAFAFVGRKPPFAGECIMMPASPCPACRKVMDRLSGYGYGALPVPRESLSVCIYCAAVNSFDEELRLIPLNAEQIEVINNDPEVQAVLKEVVGACKERIRAEGERVAGREVVSNA